MKASTILVALFLLTVGCDRMNTDIDSAGSMSCSQFNRLAGTVTQQDVTRTSATREQFEAFKKGIAHHAGMLASVRRFSEKGLQFSRNKNRLNWLMANSFEMTRSFCIGREQDEMKDVAIEQFDYLLAGMANPAPTNEVIERERKGTASLEKNENEPKQETTTMNSTAGMVGTWEGWEDKNEMWQTVMNVKRVGARYEVALDVRGPGCIGSIDGTATLSGNILTLVKEDDDKVCTITARIEGAYAYIAQDNCSHYHGAACDFGATLNKTP